MKSKRITREKVGPLRDKGENLCLEAEDVGEIQNEYFVSVFTQGKYIKDSEICVENAGLLGHFEIKKEVVLGLLQSNKVDKSPGPDGIYPRLLRGTKEEIAGALTKIFVSSLATGEVLEDWRVANVVPLFKKGNKDNPGNYRPEINTILQHVVERNKLRECLNAKRHMLESWRHLVEIILAACPLDLIQEEDRQLVIRDLLHELHDKILTEEAAQELMPVVAGAVFTLTAHLSQSVRSEQKQALSTHSHHVTLLDGSTTSVGEVTAGFASIGDSSLHIILRKLLDFILRTGGGFQRVRAHLYGALLYYLQMSQKPDEPDTLETDDKPYPNDYFLDKITTGCSTMLQGLYFNSFLMASLKVMEPVKCAGQKTMWERLTAPEDEYTKLQEDNMNIIEGYGASLMEVVCRDACDGHEIGRPSRRG
eukprot:g46182.t1